MVAHKVWAADDCVTAVVEFQALALSPRVQSVTMMVNKTIKLFGRVGAVQETACTIVTTKHGPLGHDAVCVDEQQHRHALRAKKFREGGGELRTLHALERRGIAGGAHDHRARPRPRAERVLEVLVELSPALADQAGHDHVGTRMLGDARPASMLLIAPDSLVRPQFLIEIDAVAAPAGTSTFAAAAVHFTPGARTAWHTHPHGQTIFVTEGVGRCQREGGPIEELRPGDRVFFEPGENHWHGATATRFMVHIAMQQNDESGSPVTWGEHVSDEEADG